MIKTEKVDVWGMSRADEIRAITSRMYEKSANEDIHRLMDALKNDDESMLYLLNFVQKWDQKCRENFGLRKKVANYKDKFEHTAFSLYR